MRVLSGRPKAVIVASLAAIVLIGSSAPAATLAKDPPGLARFMWALGRAESGGDYEARNASSGAYGKYQIMPASWRAWAGRYLGDSRAKPTPANQEMVAASKLRALHAGLGTWRRTAYWWLTGSSRTTGWSGYATRYVARVMGYYRSTTDEKVAAAAKRAAPSAPSASLRRFSETSPKIAYTGTWKSAGHNRYAGNAAAYATKAGATATFTFTGKRVIWYGPVGPTRGQAKVSIDGVHVKTVDLHARGFTARNAVYTKSWSKAGTHTLKITVVGTAGHPYVAIDGFTVAQ